MKKLITISSILILLTLSFTVQQTNISESFTITSIDAQGFIQGQSTTGTGEGIYYHIDELTAFNVTINKGDTVTIEWTEANYNNEDWDQIKSVTVK